MGGNLQSEVRMGFCVGLCPQISLTPLLGAFCASPRVLILKYEPYTATLVRIDDVEGVNVDMCTLIG